MEALAVRVFVVEPAEVAVGLCVRDEMLAGSARVASSDSSWLVLVVDTTADSVLVLETGRIGCKAMEHGSWGRYSQGRKDCEVYPTRQQYLARETCRLHVKSLIHARD